MKYFYFSYLTSEWRLSSGAQEIKGNEFLISQAIEITKKAENVPAVVILHFQEISKNQFEDYSKMNGISTIKGASI